MIDGTKMKSNWTKSILALACTLAVGCGGSSGPSNVAESADQSDIQAYMELQKESQAGFQQSQAMRMEQDKKDSKKKK